VSDTITQYIRKPALYQHLDGTTELTVGIALVTWTICFQISQGVMLFIAVNAALWPIFHFGTRYVRRRIVYPRSGYIKPQKHHGMFALALLICLAAVVGLSFLYAKHRAVLSDSFVFSLIMGVTLLVRASMDRLRRLGVLAIASVAIGLALQLIGPRQTSGMSWYYLLMGTAFLVSGALTLRSYLRSMPPGGLEAE
jgi:hypothetical protein